MNQKDNLDSFDKAYESDFKHNDENTWFLSRYGQYMRESIRSNNFKSILSLGIGHQIVSDILSEELSNGVSEYVILEGSKSLIDSFKIRAEYKKRISLIHTYFEDYSIDKKFDAIEMGFILEHVNDPALIVNKFKNFLSENGRMYIAVPNARSLHRLIGFEAGLLDDIYKLSPCDLQLGHKRYFDLATTLNMVEKAGLKVHNTIGLMLKPITTSQIIQLGWDEHVIKALLKIGDEYPDIANGILIEASL